MSSIRRPASLRRFFTSSNRKGLKMTDLDLNIVKGLDPNCLPSAPVRQTEGLSEGRICGSS
jgi:hypothetical protein